MLRIYKRQFRDWLASQGTEIVGEPNSREDCPLCRFIRKRHRVRKTGIQMMISYRRITGSYQSNSPWMRRFQHEAIAYQHDMNVREIRANDALEILESI